MQSYRKRIAIQSQHKPDQKPELVKTKPVKKHYSEVRAFIVKAIQMYEKISKELEPLSDEWETCLEQLQKYKIDFELLENGSYEDRKGVIEKYGR